MKHFLSVMRERFYSWITGRQLKEFTVHQLGHLDGPVQFIRPLRDQLIVFTNHSVYAVYYNYDYGCTDIRRLR